MCQYSQSVFSCEHKRWGLRMKLCKVAQDFIGGKTGNDCQIKMPYPPTSRKLQCRCRKCGDLDAKIAKARKIIGNIRETMEEKKESVDHGEDDENNQEEEDEVASQGQHEENTPDQCEKRQEAKEDMEPRNEEDQQHGIV
ncbi:hypothetical protein CDV36_009061 [Fusarium kuroshium]|uniref:Uncharacterized protein n=1 Tax=Fusarium kuroshium TaxID=2010991 RepID=A0A3M2S146_9HYPO|nr:hypothetical protein CDV36_009061 [Fusarium kuroshium]